MLFIALKATEIIHRYRSGEKMVYLFQAILLVAVLACVMLTEAFWSCSNFGSETSLNNLFTKLVVAGSGFLVYAFIDFSMLDYLMLIPGANYVIA